MEFLD